MIAFGLHRKREKTLALILEENVRKNPAKTVDFKPADLRGFWNGAGNWLLKHWDQGDAPSVVSRK